MEPLDSGREEENTYSIFQDETPAIVAKLPVDHHAGTIIGGMFLGFPGGESDSVFGNLGREAIVGPKCFLFTISAMRSYGTGQV